MKRNVFSINIGLSHTNLQKTIHHERSESLKRNYSKEYGNTVYLAKSVRVVNIPLDQSQRQANNVIDRGQIDTGARVSCSNKRDLFHSYRPYSKSFKCPIRLNAAIKQSNYDNNASIIPEGEGYLLIPAASTVGYVPVKAYFSPHLTSTLIGENCIMGHTKQERKRFSSQVIHKYLQQSHFTLVCKHTCTSNQDITIDGVLINGQCFTHPLIRTNAILPHPAIPEAKVNSLYTSAKEPRNCYGIKDSDTHAMNTYTKQAKASLAYLPLNP